MLDLSSWAYLISALFLLLLVLIALFNLQTRHESRRAAIATPQKKTQSSAAKRRAGAHPSLQTKALPALNAQSYVRRALSLKSGAAPSFQASGIANRRQKLFRIKTKSQRASAAIFHRQDIRNLPKDANLSQLTHLFIMRQNA